MARYEVTWRAGGPWKDGTRVEACVTLPVKVPGRETEAEQHRSAIEASWPGWERVCGALEMFAPGSDLQVSVEAREL
jgi:hypothetical protein